ncbi:hypothetical protein B0A61_15910, partial [Flavobacterium aquatile LMG 4008 = ATCC 11947]|uniref:HYR-like domain-containing protein n=1 Tax=Flavobacterium aquatile TaxID=245 RepID=UPI000B631CA0
MSGNNPNIIIDNSGAITMTSAVPVGSYTYTYQICSTVSPNTCDIATVIINIIDTTDPTWTTPIPLPQDITVSCSNIPVTPILTATDSCSTPIVTHVQIITPGNCQGNYTIVNTWTATDASNNDIVHVQTIT